MSILKGHLKIIALKIIAKGEICGYEIISEIEKETGWKPSFGSIYPLLNNLLKEGLVKIKEYGKSKRYSITKKGRQRFADLMKKKGEIMDKIIESVKLFDVVCDSNQSKNITPFLNEIKEGKIPSQLIMDPEMEEFRNLLFRIILDKNNEKNKRLKKIVRTMNTKLKKLI